MSKLTAIFSIAFILLLFLSTPDILSQDKEGQKKFKHSASCPKKCNTCEIAIEKALQYLSKDISGRQKQPTGPVQMVVSISLTGLAFMAEGSTPSNGKYSKEISKCVDDVITHLKAARSNKGYSDWALAFATLFLAEAYSEEQKEEQADKIKKTLIDIGKELEVDQEKDGGWPHGPGMKDYRSFTAASTVCLAGLINLKNVGIEVNDNVIKKGIKYLEDCTNGGPIAYSLGKMTPGIQPTSGPTGMAIYCIIQAGRNKNANPYSSWADYLRGGGVKDTIRLAHGSFHLCFLSTAMGMYKLGGNDWKNFKGEWLDYLINTQNEEGVSQWIPDNTPGLSQNAKGHNQHEKRQLPDSYRTAILAIILQLPYDNLTIMTSKKIEKKKK